MIYLKIDGGLAIFSGASEGPDVATYDSRPVSAEDAGRAWETFEAAVRAHAAYYVYYEHNEWEGERWGFAWPVAGNEAETGALRAALEARGDDAYAVVTAPAHVSADVVLAQALACGEGYRPHFVILPGQLRGAAAAVREAGAEGDPLYKAGIESFVQLPDALAPLLA